MPKLWSLCVLLAIGTAPAFAAVPTQLPAPTSGSPTPRVVVTQPSPTVGYAPLPAATTYTGHPACNTCDTDGCTSCGTESCGTVRRCFSRLFGLRQCGGSACGSCGSTCNEAGCPVCGSGHCGSVRHCLHRILGWATYCPTKTDCCSFCYRQPPTPPVYTFFTCPPCQEGDGITACGPGCDGTIAKCGFCTPGHRMYGLFTGHGFGFLGRNCSSCSTCR